MRTPLTVVAAGMLAAALVSPALAQSFSLATPKAQALAPSSDVRFAIRKPARKLQFAFIPPARKMFADLSGNAVLFPPLYPRKVFFEAMQTAPAFMAGRFDGAFTAYRVGDFYLALSKGYTLHSATIRNGQLFVMAKDSDGDFVALDASHFSIFRTDGTPAEAREVTGQQPGTISVLVDRSASMSGYDGEVGAALKTLATTLVGSDHCALYEFGASISTIRKPGTETCGDLFGRYAISGPRGGTPLFAAMHRAYADLQQTDALSAVVILSDGAPSDQPTADLATLAATRPTFVLWVGEHTQDHIASYSTAHAISRNGAQTEIADFLRAVSFSVKGHQTFKIANP